MKPNNNINGRVYWSAAVIVLALDFITKLIAVTKLVEHLPKPIIGNRSSCQTADISSM